MADGSVQRKQKQSGILAQFSRDLTQDAKDGNLDPVVGREKEVLRTIQILSRRRDRRDELFDCIFIANG